MRLVCHPEFPFHSRIGALGMGGEEGLADQLQRGRTPAGEDQIPTLSSCTSSTVRDEMKQAPLDLFPCIRDLLGRRLCRGRVGMWVRVEVRAQVLYVRLRERDRVGRRGGRVQVGQVWKSFVVKSRSRQESFEYMRSCSCALNSMWNGQGAYLGAWGNPTP
jgi:hypothetical protein